MVLPGAEKIAFIIVLAYLIGSIPTSIWTCKILKGIDIRKHGSGNAGATNVYRIMGIKVALFVGISDTLKGVLSVFIAKFVSGDSEIVLIAGGFAAILGHIYSVFAGFKGGKGVLVALGVFIFLVPLSSVSSLVIWSVVVALTKYVSAGSLTAATMLPLFTLFYNHIGWYHSGYIIQVFTAIVTALVVFTHRANINRLLKGTENRIKQGVK